MAEIGSEEGPFRERPHFPKGGSEFKRASEPQPSRTKEVTPLGEVRGVARFAWLREANDPQVDPKLQKIVERADKRPDSLLTQEYLVRLWDGVEALIDEGIPEDEVDMYLERIGRYAEEHYPPEEPEVEKIKDPETAEDWVAKIFDETFTAMTKGTREKRRLDAKEMYAEYTSVARALERIPEKVGKRHDGLSRYLSKEHPEGVYLKEKLELVFEAMRRLHNRKIEVIPAQGGLVDLGAIKTEAPLKPELRIELTNIRPVDWYVLLHFDELFPEAANNPETQIPAVKAIETWKAICRSPFNTNGKLKKIQIGRWRSNYTLKDFFKSEAVTREVRARVAENVGRGVVAGKLTPDSERAERLAFDILTVTLSFPLWDRERWKGKGKLEDRDLMWFDWKRADRFWALRPHGPDDTVGCYWAFEEQDDATRRQPLSKEQEKIWKILKRNKERAVFRYSRQTPSEGTIIGDFWTSTSFEDDQGIPRRLSDVPLRSIPWLKPGKFEEEVYAGYFGYSMVIAASIEAMVKQIEWKPEELLNKDFWVGLTDLTLRLAHFSPWLIARKQTPFRRTVTKAEKDRLEKERRKEVGDLVMRFRRTLARGIFWTGSYLAQPEPGRTGRGIFSRGEVYGGFGERGILDAMGAVGFLDKENLERLRNEIREFEFYTRGRGGALDVLIRGRKARG